MDWEFESKTAGGGDPLICPAQTLLLWLGIPPGNPNVRGIT